MRFCTKRRSRADATAFEQAYALAIDQFGNPTGSCVEVAALPGGVIAVRNSRYPSGPALICTRAETAAFLAEIKNGGFDHLCAGAA